MPRKRRHTRLSSYDIPANDIDPNVPVPAKDYDLVQHALVDFDELSVLSPKAKEQLVADLVDALRFARAGINVGKRGVSNKALAQQIFLSDVRRALNVPGSLRNDGGSDMTTATGLAPTRLRASSSVWRVRLPMFPVWFSLRTLNCRPSGPRNISTGRFPRL